MPLLILVTCLWAFSFSLIGEYLAGQVDNYFAVLVRIALAGALFLPFLSWRGLPARHLLALMGLGAVQLGLMYVFFYQSFLLLGVPEVLLFTIFTPLYVAVLDDALAGRFQPLHLLAAVLAVAGAAVIRFQPPAEFWAGFFVVQVANLCFAAGQVGYRRLAPSLPQQLCPHAVFGWFYLGALLVAAPAYLLFGNPTALPTTAVQWGVLAWLGLVASGLGYYLWNRGATQVDAGTLAVMNNALIPAGLVVNLLIWNRDADLPRLAAGSVILLLALIIGIRPWAMPTRFWSAK